MNAPMASEPESDFSYDDAILELTEIVRKLQANEISVDGLIDAVGRGYELLNGCDAKLSRMDAEIQVMQAGQASAADS